MSGLSFLYNLFLIFSFVRDFARLACFILKSYTITYNENRAYRAYANYAKNCKNNQLIFFSQSDAFLFVPEVSVQKNQHADQETIATKT